MSSSILLSTAIWLPILFGVAVLVIGRGGNNVALVRQVSLIGAVVAFLPTVALILGFDSGSSAMQFQELMPWVPAMGVNYHLGVDGLSVWFIPLTALITFFPVMVDSVAGFQSIDPRKYYLSKSTGASWFQTFTKIELPSAAPNIFSGLRISIVVAVTVVIVVEWLNSKTGLGYLVLRAMDSKDTSMIFATLVVGSLIGVALNGLLQTIERYVVPQRRH